MSDERALNLMNDALTHSRDLLVAASLVSSAELNHVCSDFPIERVYDALIESMPHERARTHLADIMLGFAPVENHHGVHIPLEDQPRDEDGHFARISHVLDEEGNIAPGEFVWYGTKTGRTLGYVKPPYAQQLAEVFGH